MKKFIKWHGYNPFSCSVRASLFVLLIVLAISGCMAMFSPSHKCFRERECLTNYSNPIKYFKYENGFGYWGELRERKDVEICLVCGKRLEKVRLDTLKLAYHPGNGSDGMRDFFTDSLLTKANFKSLYKNRRISEVTKCQ